MLFVYGTLRDQDVLELVLGRPIDTAALPSAQAPGFRAVEYPGRDYPALVAAAGDAAPGLLVAGLNDTDLARLDAFEGDEYRRAAIMICSESAMVSAQAYLPTIAIAPDSPAWALNLWTETHKSLLINAEVASAASARQRLSRGRA